MIPGISPIITTRSGGSAITGTITVGNYFEVFFGYLSPAAAASVGISAFGSISGDAAAFIDGAFYWSPSENEGAAAAKNTTKAKLIFQGNTYEYGNGGWDFGPEVLTWPESGTHTFEIIDP